MMDPIRIGLENSALNASRAVSLQECLDLRPTDPVVVALDRVLQAACGGGEFDDLLGRISASLGVDEPGGEGVSAADPVDDVDLVASAEMSLPSR